MKNTLNFFEEQMKKNYLLYLNFQNIIKTVIKNLVWRIIFETIPNGLGFVW